MGKLKKLTTLLAGQVPGQVIIQYSDACNALCPQCELRCTANFKRAKVPTDDVKRIIDAAVANGVQALSFTGGEPLLYADEVFDLIDYACKAGIEYTRTGTNGFVFRGVEKPDWEKRIRELAERMAATDIYTFWISIDSADPAVHEEMRGLEGVIKGIEKALPIFHEHGIYPAANLGINRNTGGRWQEVLGDLQEPLTVEQTYGLFSKAFARFYRFVIDLGFTITNACYPMSVDEDATPDLGSVYGASSADHIVKFTNEEKATLFRALCDTIPEFRGQIRIFSPRCSLHALSEYYGKDREIGYPCRGGVNYFFIDAQQVDTFACGFRGNENLGKYWQIDRQLEKQQPFCRKCDWECFRDPSELLGPFFELRHQPLSLLRRLGREKDFFKIWREDLGYYLASNYFCGRVAPDYARMAKFQKNGATGLTAKDDGSSTGSSTPSGSKNQTQGAKTDRTTKPAATQPYDKASA